jgi:hypothetical protein
MIDGTAVLIVPTKSVEFNIYMYEVGVVFIVNKLHENSEVVEDGRFHPNLRINCQ